MELLLPLLASHPMMLVGGEIAYLFSSIIQDSGNNVVKGGFLNLHLALSKYLQSKGGRIITNSKVTKIIIRGKSRRGEA
ncbi:MAG: hypothetical protein WA364_11690 [Candidatus Nitrosopolaris sp.]